MTPTQASSNLAGDPSRPAEKSTDELDALIALYGDSGGPRFNPRVVIYLQELRHLRSAVSQASLYLDSALAALGPPSTMR